MNDKAFNMKYVRFPRRQEVHGWRLERIITVTSRRHTKDVTSYPRSNKYLTWPGRMLRIWTFYSWQTVT